MMAGLQIKKIPTGAGDDIKFDVTYAKGTTKNVIATSVDFAELAMFSGTGGAYESVGFGATTDVIYLPVAGGGGGMKLTDGVGRPRALTTIGIRTGRRGCSEAYPRPPRTG